MASRPRSVSRGHVVDYILSLGAAALLVIALLVPGVCGGGVSFILLGSAAGVIGVVVAHMGGAAILMASLLFVVTLVWAGVLLALQSGCPL